MKRTLSLPVLFGIPAAFFIIIFFYIPLLTAFITLPQSGIETTWQSVADFISSEYFFSVLRFSLIQAALSSIFAVIVALPGAYLLAEHRFPGKGIIRSLAVIPFVLPPVLLVLGFILFYGNSGFVNEAFRSITGDPDSGIRILYTPLAVIFAHGVYNFPIALRFIASAWEGIPKNTMESAKILGARGFGLFRTMVLPSILPAIFSAASLIFLFCFTSFAVVLVLGGGPQVTTLEVEVYRFARYQFDFKTALTIGAFEIVINIFIILLYQFFHSNQQQEGTSQGRKVEKTWKTTPGIEKALILLYCAAVIVLLFGPIISVFAGSFFVPTTRGGPEVFSLENFTSLFRWGSEELISIGNSVSIAFFASLLSILVASGFAYYSERAAKFKGNLLAVLSTFPLAVSSVFLGFSYFWLQRMFAVFPTRALITIAHAVIALPFCVRILASSLKAVSPSLREAAATLGARPWKVFKTIELPLIRGGLIAAAVFAFALSAGELNASLMLSSNRVPTIPITIYRLIGAYRFAAAGALGVLLMTASAAAFYMIDRFSKKGGFF